MLDKIIINEFMNHFYTPYQLSVFLNIPLPTVERVLNDKELIIAVLGNKGIEKLNTHMDRIYLWIYSNSVSNEKIEGPIDEKIVEIAKYIIINNSSIRSTAEHFKLGKSTIHSYIEKRLPCISIVLYKKVFDVIKGNKSLSVDESISNYDFINYEYDLLMSGKTLKEIAEILGLSFQRVQRDLSTRISVINSKLGDKTKEHLYNNKMSPLIEHQFKKNNM